MSPIYKYLYIMNRKENHFVEYGQTDDLHDRLINTSIKDSYITNYQFIFKVSETANYKLADKIDTYDKIISALCKKDNEIEEMENRYSAKFWALKEMKKFLYHGNLVKCSGVEFLVEIFKNVYPMLGLYIDIVSDDEIKNINYDVINMFYNVDILELAKMNYEIYHKLESNSSDLNIIQKSCAGILGWSKAFNRFDSIANDSIANDSIANDSIANDSIDDEEEIDFLLDNI
jgi:hypothetical protein